MTTLHRTSPTNSRLEVNLFVIIPVYENWEDTMECLRALERQTDSRFQVLIIDDGSLSPPPPGIYPFRFAEHLRHTHRGFAGTCNAGARAAISRKATHLLFLNNDTAFSTGFIESWHRAVAARPKDILSPLVYWLASPSKIWYSGGNLSILAPFFKLRREYLEATEVELASGCALLIPAGLWRALGGFEERYGTYFEDLDLTLRAKKMGSHTYIVPDNQLKVWHKASGSFRRAPRWQQQYRLLASRLIFIRLHFRGVRKYLCLVLSGLQIALTIVLILPELPAPLLLWQSLVEGLAEHRQSCHGGSGTSR